ncbi:hypothetical protein GCM10009113_03850 [Marinobacter szutsaonensis]
MKTLKNILRKIRQLSGRLFECKSGILLCRPVKPGEDPAQRNADAGPKVVRITAPTEGIPLKTQEFQWRKEQGNELFGLVVDDELRSYGWVASAGSRVGVLHDLHLTVPEQAFYIWDCATDPAFRGRGYFQKLLDGIVAEHQSGSKLGLVAVDSHNEASKSALLKSGFRPAFTYLSVRSIGVVLFSVVVKNGKFRRAQRQFDALSQGDAEP